MTCLSYIKCPFKYESILGLSFWCHCLFCYWHQLYIVLITLTVWVMITCRFSPSTFFFKNTSPILVFYMHVNYVSILITLYVNKFVEFTKKSFIIWLRLHWLYIQIRGKLYPYEMELAGTMKDLKFYFSCKLSSSLATISEMLV